MKLTSQELQNISDEVKGLADVESEINIYLTLERLEELKNLLLNQRTLTRLICLALRCLVQIS